MNVVEAIPAWVRLLALTLFLFGVTGSVVKSQANEIFSPKILLGQWAIEPNKRIYEQHTRRVLFWDRQYRVERRFQAAYIEVYINHILGSGAVERVMPQVVWVDREGETINRNNGRWWISHVHAYVDTSELQMVNLWTNRQRRKLYFASHEKGQLYVWHRTYDNKEPMEPLENGEYKIVVELHPISGRGARYEFVLTSSPEGLSLDRLSLRKKIQRRLGGFFI